MLSMAPPRLVNCTATKSLASVTSSGAAGALGPATSAASAGERATAGAGA